MFRSWTYTVIVSAVLGVGAFWPAAVVAQEPLLTPVGTGDLLEHQLVVSGYAGGSTGGDIGDGEVAVGAAVDYLRNGRYGVEVLAGFAPGLTLERAFSDDIQLNNYMFNVIGAAPFGLDATWQPYVSAGFGAVTLHSGLNDAVFGDTDDTRFGGNIGFGIMGFAERVGIRADVRYFRAGGDGDSSAKTDFPVEEDLSYWRPSVGIAYRW